MTIGLVDCVNQGRKPWRLLNRPSAREVRSEAIEIRLSEQTDRDYSIRRHEIPLRRLITDWAAKGAECFAAVIRKN